MWMRHDYDGHGDDNDDDDDNNSVRRENVRSYNIMIILIWYTDRYVNASVYTECNKKDWDT